MTLKAAVIGHPIAHSLSPALHGYWLQTLNLNGTYEAIDMAPENLKDQLYSLIEAGYTGVNVTIPHKENAFKLCDSLTLEAQRIGAVNILKFHKTDTGFLIEGHNSDHVGFWNYLIHQSSRSYQGVTATILGAGGAARAVLYALLASQCFSEIRLTNRSVSKAEDLRDDFDGSFPATALTIYDWEDRQVALKGCDLLINSTSLGMTGQPDLDISLDPLSQSACIYDLVYKPLDTSLLQQARARHLTAIDGLGMLLFQAQPAFRLFFGSSPEITDDLVRHMKQKLGVI
jgi:shikimate dehydrogenase